MQKVFITSVPRGIFYRWKKEREQHFTDRRDGSRPPHVATGVMGRTGALLGGGGVTMAGDIGQEDVTSLSPCAPNA